MPSIIDISALTLNEDEARSVNEAIFTGHFADEEVDIADDHLIVTGIIRDKFIPFFGHMGLVGRASSGCDPDEDVANIPTSQKKWAPKEFEVRLVHCKDDIGPLFKLFIRTKYGTSKYNLTGSEEMEFIEFELSKAIMAAIKRFAWFGDTAADNISNGGQVTNGVDVKYFNVIDGIWKQVDEIVAADATKLITIPENSAASKATQYNLDANRSLELFRSMYNAADERLTDDPNAVFHVTRSILKNWQDLLEDKSLIHSLNRLENGTSTQFSYRGIPIKAHSEWDRTIKSYLDNGTMLHRPHRIILTTKNNIPIGCPNEEQLSSLESFYDKKSKKNYMDAVWDMDVKVIEDHKIQVAY